MNIIIFFITHSIRHTNTQIDIHATVAVVIINFVGAFGQIALFYRTSFNWWRHEVYTTQITQHLHPHINRTQKIPKSHSHIHAHVASTRLEKSPFKKYNQNWRRICFYTRCVIECRVSNQNQNTRHWFKLTTDNLKHVIDSRDKPKTTQHQYAS